MIRALLDHISIMPPSPSSARTVQSPWIREAQRAALDNYTIAAGILEMIAELNAAPDVAQVHWAQFQEPGADPRVWGGPWGSVTIDGVVKASYNALYKTTFKALNEYKYWAKALQPYLHYCDSLLLIAAVVSVLQLAKGTDDSNCCGFQENH